MIRTSVDSYIFVCPKCLKKARYAYSFDEKIEVFCNGFDFGTKAVIDGQVMEISDVQIMAETNDNSLAEELKKD